MLTGAGLEPAARVPLLRPRDSRRWRRHHRLCQKRIAPFNHRRWLSRYSLYVFSLCTASPKRKLTPGADGLGGYRIQNRQPYGVELCLLASIILGGSSIPRAIRGRKPIPTVLSLLATYGMYTFGTAFRRSA